MCVVRTIFTHVICVWRRLALTNAHMLKLIDLLAGECVKGPPIWYILNAQLIFLSQPNHQYTYFSHYFVTYSRGRGLFRHCAYPTRRTGKVDSTREFPLDLYRGNFLFVIFVTHWLKVQTCEHYIQKRIVWFHEDLKVLDNFSIIFTLTFNGQRPYFT